MDVAEFEPAFGNVYALGVGGGGRGTEGSCQRQLGDGLVRWLAMHVGVLKDDRRDAIRFEQ